MIAVDYAKLSRRLSDEEMAEFLASIKGYDPKPYRERENLARKAHRDTNDSLAQEALINE